MAYDLTRVTKEFRNTCLKAGAGTGAVVPVKINSRLTRTLGRVTLEYDYNIESYVPTLVEFSKQFLETSTDDSIRDIILHEAAHLIATDRTGEDHGHDAYFKSICKEIGTLNDGTSTKVNRTVADKEIYKYTITCPRCGNIGGQSRMSKTLKAIKFCTCKKCGGVGLTYTQNW